jgi:hypothetical protein
MSIIDLKEAKDKKVYVTKLRIFPECKDDI